MRGEGRTLVARETKLNDFNLKSKEKGESACGSESVARGQGKKIKKDNERGKS